MMSPAAFALSHFSGAVMHGSPAPCQDHLAISGWKNKDVISFFFLSVEQVAQAALGPFTFATVPNWKRGLNVRHSNLLG